MGAEFSSVNAGAVTTRCRDMVRDEDALVMIGAGARTEGENTACGLGGGAGAGGEAATIGRCSAVLAAASVADVSLVCKF